MNQYIGRYKTWFEKTDLNLSKAKGTEGHLLRSRFQSLELREDLLGCLYHVGVLRDLVEEFSVERQNLRWVSKLKDDCERWQHLFDCSVRLYSLDRDCIVQALVESQIDVEFAINLS